MDTLQLSQLTLNLEMAPALPIHTQISARIYIKTSRFTNELRAHLNLNFINSMVIHTLVFVLITFVEQRGVVVGAPDL